MDKENELWCFATAFYAAPDAAKRLLTLQDTLNLNVNELIYAIWLASINYQLNAVPAEGSDIKHWHTRFVLPARELRCLLKQQVKAGFNALSQDCYEKILVTELALEKAELCMLFEQKNIYASKNVDLKPALLIEKNIKRCFDSLNIADEDVKQCEYLAGFAINYLTNIGYKA